MKDYTAIMERMEEQFGEVFAPASEADLGSLRSLKLPESSVEFYRRFAPVQVIENSQSVRLLPIAQIVEDNTEMMPGRHTAAHGLVVFASNFSGDAYAYDVHQFDTDGEPRVVLISHAVVGEETTAEEIGKLSKPVAGSFAEFLDQFLRGEVDEECIDDYD